MVNSSRAAAAHSWAACSRPGDTWRGELARHASQNENWNPPAQAETLPDPASRANGGIAQLVERRLCKPNVAGSSPTASTNSGLTVIPSHGHTVLDRSTVRPFDRSTKRGRVAQLVRASH